MYAVDIKNLNFSYEGEKSPTLKNINFRIREGEFVVLVGPSGCGKSTFCLTLNGVIPQAPYYLHGSFLGSVKVFGWNTKEYSVSKLSRVVGMVFQDAEPQLFTTTVEDDLVFALENFGLPREEIKKRLQEAVTIAGIQHLINRAPYNLSGGEKFRVVIAAILAMRPKILILDEPTSNLDPIGTRYVFSLFKELHKKQGFTAILVEHKIDEIAEFADRIVVMDQGEILFSGPPREVFANVDKLEKIGIRLPQVAELMYKLKKSGHLVQQYPITVEEAFEFLSPSLRKIESTEIEASEKSQSDPKEVAIEVRDLSYTYPDGTEALKNINIKFYQGQLVTLLGSNGAGKTTLCLHLIGLKKPSKGEIYVDGLNVKKATVAQLAKRVGYAFQNPHHQLFADTVWDEVAFGPKNIGLQREEIEKNVDEALQITGLSQFKEKDPMALSFGQKRRLTVASAYTMKPRILVLDEPTFGQDYANLVKLLGVIHELKARGVTTIMITHDMMLAAEYAERVVVMDKGRIIADGCSKEIFSDQKTLEKANLLPPPVTRLATMLQSFGIPRNALSVTELFQYIKERLD